MKSLKIIIIVFFAIFNGVNFSLAMNVAIIGSNGNSNIVTYLTNNGFVVTDYSTTIPSAATLATYHAVVLLRMNGNDDLKNWVNNGGLLITEWSAADWAVSNVLTATVSSSGSIGTGTNISFSGSTLGAKLSIGLSNPYSDGGASEFFYTFGSIGSGAETLATRPTNIPAILGAAYGSGYTFVIAYDWADGFPSTSSNSGILLKNALNSGASGGSPAPANPTGVSAITLTICIGSSTQLTANGAQGTVYWYTASCGGTQVTTGNPVTVSPTTTTTYYARNYDNSQFSSGCASVTITVNPLLQYRSKAGLNYSSPRNWTTAANWEQYNGSSWVAATSYPGELSNACSSPLVTILTGHQMEISGINITLPNLKIEGTGKLFVRSTAKLYVNGQVQLDQNSAGAIVVE